MAEEKPKYKCTETELYSITELAIDNLEADLGAFTAKKAKYVTAFVDALRVQRTSAMSLPGEEARNANHQTLKNQLPALADACKDNFKDLQGYIRDAWPTEDPKPRYEAAGQDHYSKIGTVNWEEVVALNTSMAQFIVANTAALTTPGGMPVGFSTTVTDAQQDFNTTYSQYKLARETGSATAAKITANNALYTACIL